MEMENKISRRDFLKGASAVAAGVALSNVEVKAEAATPSFNDVYGSFVNAYADGIVGANENIYGIQITMGNVEQFAVTYRGKKFIYEYYVNCMKNKSKGSLSNFYKDANQKAFLNQCEAFMHHLSVYPNDTTVATNFLNYVKDNMLVKSNKTAEGEFANFDAHYFKDVALYETVCEMVQVAWDKVPAVKTLRHDTKPEGMGDTDGYWCAQVIIDECAGRSDTSDREGHPRHSGITKGNTQWEELIKLNYFAPNKEAQKMVIRSLYTIFTGSELCDILNITPAEYATIKSELQKQYNISLTNCIDAENNIEDTMVPSTIIALADKCPEAIALEDVDAINAIYFNALSNASSVYAKAVNGFKDEEKDKVIDLDKIYDVDMFAETKSNSRTRKIA